MSAGSQSAPPTTKKARKNRGTSQKSHECDNRTKSEHRAHTDMTPDDYLQVLESTDLKENEKLPHTSMSHWKIVNDQSNFSNMINF